MTRAALVLLVACSGSSGRPAGDHPLPPSNAATTAPAPIAVPPAQVPTACGTLGALVICGKPYKAPSHGGEEFVRNARYTVENRGTQAVSLSVANLDVVDPTGQHLPLSVGSIEWRPELTGALGAIPPGATVDMTIFGDGSIAALRYHVVYHHETRFQAGGAELVVNAGELYFRHPHQRP